MTNRVYMRQHRTIRSGQLYYVLEGAHKDDEKVVAVFVNQSMFDKYYNSKQYRILKYEDVRIQDELHPARITEDEELIRVKTELYAYLPDGNIIYKDIAVRTLFVYEPCLADLKEHVIDKYIGRFNNLRALYLYYKPHIQERVYRRETRGRRYK